METQNSSKYEKFSVREEIVVDDNYWDDPNKIGCDILNRLSIKIAQELITAGYIIIDKDSVSKVGKRIYTAYIKIIRGEKSK